MVQMRDITNSYHRTPTKTPMRSPSLSSSSQQHQQQTKITKPSPISDNVMRRNLLQKKVSRLDLLDNSQFTSFPLAPPAPTSVEKTRRSHSSKKTSLWPSLSKGSSNVHNIITENMGDDQIHCQETEVDDEDDISIKDTTFDDESLIEEPIILIEDYIKPQRTLRKNRKISVLDLKKTVNLQTTNYLSSAQTLLFSNKLQHQLQKKASVAAMDINKSNSRTSSIPGSSSGGGMTSKSYAISSLLLTTNIDIDPLSTSTSNHSAAQLIMSLPKAQKEQTAADPLNIEFIPNNYNNELKSCIICDKPLYELSSQLKNHFPYQYHQQGSKEDFKEIVCSNCTDKYEKLSKLIENYDDEEKDDLDDDDFEIYESDQQPTTAMLKPGFSEALISSLQSQLHPYENSKKEKEKVDEMDGDMMWLRLARDKLRWRWRLTGLLPKFLTHGNE